MKPAISLRVGPITNRAKALVTLGIVTSSLWCSAPASSADTTYSWVFTPTAANETFKWADLAWTGGAPGDYPQAGDTAIITRNNGQNTFLDVLAGEQTIENLTYNGGTNQLRLRNNSSGVQSALTITSELNVTSGLLVLTKLGNGHQFRIETGSTSVANGATLRLGSGTASVAFESGTTTIDQGGLIEILWAPTDTGANFGAVTNNGTFDLSSSADTAAASYAISATSLSGSSTSVVNMSGGATSERVLRIIGSSSTKATYDGVISGAVGTIAISKEGEGVQILSSANTYTGGTMISGGVLAVTNTSGSGLGSGAVEIRDQGVLSGSGTVALTNEAIHVMAGGGIAPGAFDEGGSGFSTLRLSGAATSGPVLTMEDDTFFTFQLGAANASDRIEFLDFNTGDWIINSSEGIAINATGAEVGGIYTLFSFLDGDGNAIGSGLTDGLLAGVGLEGYEVLFHYGNDLGQSGYGTITMEVVKPIPEPGTVGLILLGGAWFLSGFGLPGRKTS